MSTSIMTGFDWPFQESRTAGGTGRVRDLLTTSPVSFGKASVAEATQLLPAAARSFTATNNTAEAAKIVRFRIRPLRARYSTRTQKRFGTKTPCACSIG